MIIGKSHVIVQTLDEDNYYKNTILEYLEIKYIYMYMYKIIMYAFCNSHDKINIYTCLNSYKNNIHNLKYVKTTTKFNYTIL